MDTKKRSSDVNVLAFQVVQEATQELPQQTEPSITPGKEKNPHAMALGRLGGLKGGRARAEKLSSKKRKEIASKAAKTRWAKNLKKQ